MKSVLISPVASCSNLRADAFAPVFLLDSYLGQITCMHIEDTMTYHFAVKESTETD